MINLPSLEYRQLRGDIIQVFKIAWNFYDCSPTEIIFDFTYNKKLRGHPYKINKQFTNTTKFKKFFSNRVVNKWNNLPYEIVQSKTINEFKNRFDLLNKDIMYKIDINYYASWKFIYLNIALNYFDNWNLKKEEKRKSLDTILTSTK